MVSTTAVPTTPLTSLIAASLRLVNSGVFLLPADELQSVLSLLENTKSIARHAVSRLDHAAQNTVCPSSSEHTYQDAINTPSSDPAPDYSGCKFEVVSSSFQQMSMDG